MANVAAHATPNKEIAAEFQSQRSDNINRMDQFPASINPQIENDTSAPEIPEGDLLNLRQYETYSEIDLMESISFDSNDPVAAASTPDEISDNCRQIKEKSEIADELLDSLKNGHSNSVADTSIEYADHDIGPRQLQHDCGPDDEECDGNYKPHLEAGDHVIRWKLLKAVLYPIQIHGIVLGVHVIEGETDVSGNPKINVVIADFGYTKSQSYDEEGKNKKAKGIHSGINKMMQSYYNIQKGRGSKNPSQEHDDLKSDLDKNIPLEEKIIDDHVIDEKLKRNPNGKRFRVILLTDAKQIKKWTKINYGSIFAPDGKLAKMKNWLKLKSLRKVDVDDGIDPLKENQRSDTCIDENMETVVSPTALDSNGGRKGEKEADTQHEIAAIVGENDQSATLAQMMTEANKIESQNRSRRRLLPRMKPMQTLSSVQSAVQSKSNRALNMISKPWFGGSHRKDPLTEENSSYSPLMSAGCDNAETEADDKIPVTSSSSEPTADEPPKLPKPDPRDIVLARTNYILAQQDLPESESSLPPYHVLYSNSECLAVWCKTGTFSTLQAAVFLHSTAVGNAKSTVGLAAAIGATQPWLIPLVGIYGIVSIGMPYYLLKRCHVKWKEGEKSLTDGFWSSADPIVFVAAIENWSRLGTSTQS